MIQRYQPIGEPTEGPINPLFTPDDNGRVCLWIDVEPLIAELARYKTPMVDDVEE